MYPANRENAPLMLESGALKISQQAHFLKFLLHVSSLYIHYRSRQILSEDYSVTLCIPSQLWKKNFQC